MDRNSSLTITSDTKLIKDEKPWNETEGTLRDQGEPIIYDHQTQQVIL